MDWPQLITALVSILGAGVAFYSKVTAQLAVLQVEVKSLRSTLDDKLEPMSRDIAELRVRVLSLEQGRAA